MTDMPKSVSGTENALKSILADLELAREELIDQRDNLMNGLQSVVDDVTERIINLRVTIAVAEKACSE